MIPHRRVFIHSTILGKMNYVLSSIGFSTPKWKELLSKDLEEILNENKEGKKDTRI